MTADVQNDDWFWGQWVTDYTWVEGSSVTLVDCCASDLAVVQAARVSTVGADSLDSGESAGLIAFLMRNRHGSPFEQGYFRFLVDTPIFVAREFMRHRIASYNEVSGRYSKMGPRFYSPPPERPLVQVGKAGAYTFEMGSDVQFGIVEGVLRTNAVGAWQRYEQLLDAGIAREVARMVLPLNLMTTFYVAMNPRGLMNFLSLRVRSEDSAYPSFPMQEIHEVALLMEGLFEDKMPLTRGAFVDGGRVAP